MRDISLHLIDIIQNSITAGAKTVSVAITVDRAKNELMLEIADNGCGMDEELLRSVIDPFVTTRTTRKIGLGIPLLKASAQRASGDLSITSAKGVGTVVKAWFQVDNIDRIPLGDIAESVVVTILANPGIEMDITFKRDEEVFKFNSFEIMEKLGDVPITDFEVLSWMKEYINDGIKIIFGGVLNEVDC